MHKSHDFNILNDALRDDLVNLPSFKNKVSGNFFSFSVGILLEWDLLLWLTVTTVNKDDENSECCIKTSLRSFVLISMQTERICGELLF